MSVIQTGMDSISAIIEKINTLNTTYPDINTEVPAIDAITNAIKKLSNLTSGENGIDVATLTADVDAISQSISDFIEGLNEFVGAEINDGIFTTLQTALQNVLTAAKDLTTYLTQVASEWGNQMIQGFADAHVEAGIVRSLANIPTAIMSSGLPQRMATVGTSLAQTLITALQSALASINVNSTINVNARMGALSGLGNVVGGVQSAFARMGVQASTGGYITRNGVLYRARGGSIFKRRGTDTVPAMLTPGEYVMNRGAVSAFGIEFMRRINHLDIAGAVKALSHKVGRSLIPHGTAIHNTNITRNNNQKLTINNNNSSQNFTYLKASRYLGALH